MSGGTRGRDGVEGVSTKRSQSRFITARDTTEKTHSGCCGRLHLLDACWIPHEDHRLPISHEGKYVALGLVQRRDEAVVVRVVHFIGFIDVLLGHRQHPAPGRIGLLQLRSDMRGDNRGAAVVLFAVVVLVAGICGGGFHRSFGPAVR